MPATCKNHPTTAAGYLCSDCRTPLCDECITTNDDGQILCQRCHSGDIPLAGESRGRTGAAMEELAEAPAAPQYPCIGHPQSPAVARCSACQALVCATCDFVFDGQYHLCPPCALGDSKKLTPKRKKMAVWAMVLAGLNLPATGLGLVIMAMAPKLVSSEESLVVVNILSSLVLVVCLGLPTMGMLLGFYSYQRKAFNPGYLMIGPIANGLFAAGWALVLLVGTIMMLSRG